MPGFTEAFEMRYKESYPWRAYLKSQGYDIPDYAHFYDPISPDPSRQARPDDPAYRIPLVIRDPDQPAQHGTTVDAFTETVDITPTLLDLIGQAVPTSMNGKSLRPFLQGDAPETWRDCVHMELDFGEPDADTDWQKATGARLELANLASLREQRFKLVHFNGNLPPLLFDLKDDPDEMHNLADDPAHMATRLRLTQKLLSHRMEHADRTISDVKITRDGAINFVW